MGYFLIVEDEYEKCTIFTHKEEEKITFKKLKNIIIDNKSKLSLIMGDECVLKFIRGIDKCINKYGDAYFNYMPYDKFIFYQINKNNCSKYSHLEQNIKINKQEIEEFIKNIIDAKSIPVKYLKNKGIRYNQYKTRLELIPPEFIDEVGKVFTFGAKKYSADNWKHLDKEQQDMIIGSLLRHILEYQKGNELDSESGLSHLAHAACNIAMMIWFNNKNK